MLCGTGVIPIHYRGVFRACFRPCLWYYIQVLKQVQHPNLFPCFGTFSVACPFQYLFQGVIQGIIYPSGLGSTFSPCFRPCFIPSVMWCVTMVIYYIRGYVTQHQYTTCVLAIHLCTAFGVYFRPVLGPIYTPIQGTIPTLPISPLEKCKVAIPFSHAIYHSRARKYIYIPEVGNTPPQEPTRAPYASRRAQIPIEHSSNPQQKGPNTSQIRRRVVVTLIPLTAYVHQLFSQLRIAHVLHSTTTAQYTTLRQWLLHTSASHVLRMHTPPQQCNSLVCYSMLQYWQLLYHHCTPYNTQCYTLVQTCVGICSQQRNAALRRTQHSVPHLVQHRTTLAYTRRYLGVYLCIEQYMLRISYVIPQWCMEYYTLRVVVIYQWCVEYWQYVCQDNTYRYQWQHRNVLLCTGVQNIQQPSVYYIHHLSIPIRYMVYSSTYTRRQQEIVLRIPYATLLLFSCCAMLYCGMLCWYCLVYSQE